MRFSRYFNNKSGRNNIYSFGNLLRMTLEELLEREDELVYQNNTIGIPDDDELNASDFVEPFVGANGYQGWRSRSLPATVPTGFASDVGIGGLDAEQASLPPMSLPEMQTPKNTMFKKQDGVAMPKRNPEYYEEDDEDDYDEEYGDDDTTEQNQEQTEGDEIRTQNAQKEEKIINNVDKTQQAYNNLFELAIEKNQEIINASKDMPVPNLQNVTANANTVINTTPQNIVNDVKTNLPVQNIGDINKQNIIKNKNLYEKYQGLTKAEALQKMGSKFPVPILDREYYSIATHLADGEKISEKMRNQNYFYTLKDVKNSEMKTLYKKKIAKMYNIDENNPLYQEKINNAQIVSPKVTSELYNMVKNSKEMQEWVTNNFERLQKYGAKPGESIVFEKGPNFLKEKDRALFTILHRAALDNMKVSPDGSLSGRLNDPYNFELWSNKSVFKDINNNAYYQQEKGQLENYLLSMPLYFSKEEIEEILKLAKRKK